MTEPVCRAVGDTGLLVDFGEPADEVTWRRVVALDRALAAAPPRGVRETVPAYTACLIVFDPLLTDHAALAAAVTARQAPAVVTAGRTHVVPVDYRAGGDIGEVASRLGRSVEEVAEHHCAGRYHVAMYGFAPGYAYLGGLPASLNLPRKPAAVRGVPVGSILIAGGQCLITTLSMPTGWWMIGRTDVRVLDPAGERPFAFDPGDEVRFVATGP